MFSFVRDTVLDPFAGTGTTTVAAVGAHRNSIAVDVERSYVDRIRRRLSQLPLTEEYDVLYEDRLSS